MECQPRCMPASSLEPSFPVRVTRVAPSGTALRVAGLQVAAPFQLLASGIRHACHTKEDEVLLPATTSMLVDLLVIGTFALLWVLALVPLPFLHHLSASPVPLTTASTFLLLAPLYFLGMLVNFTADMMCSPLDRVLGNVHGGKARLQRARERVFLHSPDASRYLFERRGLIRIFRANIVNFSITALVLGYNVNQSSSDLHLTPRSGAALFGLLAALCLLAYIRSLYGYFDFLSGVEDSADGRTHNDSYGDRTS